MFIIPEAVLLCPPQGNQGRRGVVSDHSLCVQVQQPLRPIAGLRSWTRVTGPRRKQHRHTQLHGVACKQGLSPPPGCPTDHQGRQVRPQSLHKCQVLSTHSAVSTGRGREADPRGLPGRDHLPFHCLTLGSGKCILPRQSLKGR